MKQFIIQKKIMHEIIFSDHNDTKLLKKTKNKKKTKAAK